VTDPSRAVFLSYASQDAEAAQQLCNALRAAGIEVWFDKSELRGGDAWDASIRRQIKSCALFIPVISKNTHVRGEGYFRLEWKLAVDRSHLMAADLPFLLPVVVDDTPDQEDRVPDRFREVQWSRLPGGANTDAFVDRVRRLLSLDSTTLATSVLSSALPTASTRSTHSASFSFAPWIVGGLLILASGYFVADKYLTSKHAVPPSVSRPTPEAQPAVPTAVFAPPAHSVAVLPFTNLSGDPQQEYFSDGISEELINALSHIDALAVAARTSSFAFKGKDVDTAGIARKLNVASILEGSVRRSGNTIRITAQLINTVNGFHIWSESYDRDLKDVLVLQTDIATAVAQQLRAKLLGDEAGKIEVGGTHFPEAYDAYLLGRHFADRGNLDGYRRGAEAFRKATEIDPEYAKAYASLSSMEVGESLYTNDLSAMARALTTADKAIALAPQLASGYGARFWARRGLLDFPGARSDTERALALLANGSDTQNDYGLMLATYGRLAEAIAALKKAIELDPLNDVAWVNLAEYLVANHDFPGARRALARAQALNPDFDYGQRTKGVLDLLESRYEDALTAFQKDSDEVARQEGVALVEYSRGQQQKSQQALEALITKYAAIGAYQIAEVYAWQGDKDKAFQWLERAIRQRDMGLSWVTYDPLLSALRSDSRYSAILRTLKLSQ
jgi:TolB-like protein/tetratricopeptide (TPR) repeat protein